VGSVSSEGASDLPDVSRDRARILVLSLGAFWSLAAGFSFVVESPLAVPIVLGALAAGWTFFATLFRVWDRQMLVWPGRGYLQRYDKSIDVMLSLFRPRFIARVLRATGWPPSLVVVVLLALLVGPVAAG
jgi:hypothetical protein